MEKLIKIPFDTETAKRIQNGEIDGKITTRGGRDARVIYWEKKGEMPIVALIQDFDGVEVAFSYPNDGRYVSVNKDNEFDLLIQVPEWATFKTGDLVVCGGDMLLIIGTINKYKSKNKNVSKEFLCTYYVASVSEGTLDIDFDGKRYLSCIGFTKATKEQREKFIRLLKEDGSDKANKILEKYFGINTNPKYKDGDILLVRCTNGEDYVFVYKSGEEEIYTYCSIYLGEYRKLFLGVGCVCRAQSVSFIRYATKKERQMLRDALIKDGRSEAKECLRFFNIKTEHKFKTFEKVLVRDSDDDEWYADLFSHYDKMHPHRYLCVTRFYKQCIPYKGNEDLLGTTKSPSTYGRRLSEK